MKTTITPTVCGSGGMVDTRVLGTRIARCEGSSPFFRTTKKVAKININSDYVTVYVIGVLNTEGKKEGTVVLVYCETSRLRNYRPSFNLSHVASIVVIPSFFLNIQHFHLWVVSYMNVYRLPYTAYMWVEKKEICSRYVQ